VTVGIARQHHGAVRRTRNGCSSTEELVPPIGVLATVALRQLVEQAVDLGTADGSTHPCPLWRDADECLDPLGW
jgi:hypothetical protein